MNPDGAATTLVDLLESLAPLPAPEPISMWPQTSGWLVVASVLLALGVWAARRFLLAYRANAYRRAAVREVDESQAQPRVLAEVLRRTALAAYPRADVAGIYGQEWLEFLDRSYGGNGFTQGAGRAIATAPYRTSQEENAELSALVMQWVKQHRSIREAEVSR